MDLPNTLYHVIARGINRSPIFKDTADKSEFLDRFQVVLKDTGCACYTWVLMSNHFHLLLKPARMPLSHVMRRLLTGYAIYFNRRHRRSGHLFQNRFKSILCQKDTYLLELVRYIHLNPVRASLVKDLGELDRYPWSGHSCLVGKRLRKWQSRRAVLALFGREVKDATAKYRAYIAEGWNQGRREDLTGGGLRRSLGGWKGIWELKKDGETAASDERILGDGEFVKAALKEFEEQLRKREAFKRQGRTLDELAAKVGEVMGVETSGLKSRHRCNAASAARSLFAYWGCCELGLTGKEIAAYLTISRASVSIRIAKGRELAKGYVLKIS